MVPSTLSSWALLIARALTARGLDADELFRRAGMHPEHTRDPNARYPLISMQRLWKLATESSQDPCFGLDVAQLWHPTTFHAIGYTALASSSLREALSCVVRYNRVVTTGARVELGENDSEVFVTVSALYPQIAPASFHAAAAALVILCREARGGEVNPLWVKFPQANGPCTERLRRFFHCPISVGGAHMRMAFSREDLNAPLPTAHPALVRANEELLKQYLTGLGSGDLALQVRLKLVSLLPSGEIEQTTVARSLNLSLRSLQRQLKQEGVTFRQLIDDTRRDLAKYYLRDSTLTVSEVAYLLGFNETSSFSRAFRRWTGRAPRWEAPS
jgi:AraC-like DNA-binding protein